MDTNRLMAMLTRMFIRSATDAGLDALTRGAKPTSSMTAEERKEAAAAKATARKFRQMTRLGRRFFR